MFEEEQDFLSSNIKPKFKRRNNFKKRQCFSHEFIREEKAILPKISKVKVLDPTLNDNKNPKLSTENTVSNFSPNTNTNMGSLDIPPESQFWKYMINEQKKNIKYYKGIRSFNQYIRSIKIAQKIKNDDLGAKGSPNQKRREKVYRQDFTEIN